VEREEEEVSRPSSASCCDMSDAVTEPVFERSRTAKDSRIVWRCAGGIELRGSEDARARGIGVGGRDGDARGEDAFTVDAVALLAKVGRRAVVSLSYVECTVENPEEAGSRGREDLVGLPGVFKFVFVPRVVSHERSSAPLVGGGLNEREEVDDVNFVGE